MAPNEHAPSCGPVPFTQYFTGKGSTSRRPDFKGTTQKDHQTEAVEWRDLRRVQARQSYVAEAALYEIASPSTLHNFHLQNNGTVELVPLR